MHTASDSVRTYVLEHHIEPARQRGDRTVTVRAADLHNALGFRRQSALVCSAIASLKLRKQARIELVRIDNPSVGSLTAYTFALL